VSVAAPRLPVWSWFCVPGTNVSPNTWWLSEVAVIVHGRPSASIESHRPPSFAVIQSKPP
jgi:hypothetical protein